jgi:4-hydroxybenzoate polyprenyltransferase
MKNTWFKRCAFLEVVSARALGRIKLCALAIGVLATAGIAAVMVLARGTGEDITGIVAPGLLVTFASFAAAAVAMVLQKRGQKMMDDRAAGLLDGDANEL